MQSLKHIAVYTERQVGQAAQASEADQGIFVNASATSGKQGRGAEAGALAMPCLPDSKWLSQ